MPKQPVLLTANEAAERLHVSSAYVRRACQHYRERLQAAMREQGATESTDLPDAQLAPRPDEIACTFSGTENQWAYRIYAALLDRHVVRKPTRASADDDGESHGGALRQGVQEAQDA